MDDGASSLIGRTSQDSAVDTLSTRDQPFIYRESEHARMKL